MYCPSCGYEVSEEDEYCWHCGHEFDEGGFSESQKRDSGGDEHTRTSDTRPQDRPQNEDILAPLVHVLSLFFWVFAPLVVFLVTENDFVEENARNALNWQISYSIYMVVSVFLILFVIGLLTAFVVGLLDLVFCVVAAVKAADGETWEYPLTLELV